MGFKNEERLQIIFRADVITLAKFILLFCWSIIHKNVYLRDSEGVDYESDLQIKKWCIQYGG